MEPPVLPRLLLRATPVSLRNPWINGPRLRSSGCWDSGPPGVEAVVLVDIPEVLLAVVEVDATNFCR